MNVYVFSQVPYSHPIRLLSKKFHVVLPMETRWIHLL